MAVVHFKLASKVALLAIVCLLLATPADADADARRRSDVGAEDGGNLERSPSAGPSKVIRPTAVRRTNATRIDGAAAPVKPVTTKLPSRGQKRPQPQNAQNNMVYPLNDGSSLYVASTTEHSDPVASQAIMPTPSLGSKIQSIAANNLRPLANLFQNAPVSSSSTITGRPLHNRRTATTSFANIVTSTATAYSITTVGQIVFQPTFVTQTLTVSSTLTTYILVPAVSTTTNVIITVSVSTIIVPVFSTTTIIIPRTIRA